jgi:hypothetical protein
MPKQTHATILWLSGIEDLDAPPFSIHAFGPSSITRLPVSKDDNSESSREREIDVLALRR